MRRKVVVVEDDAPFCYAVRKALEQAGYAVESYAGSTEAWSVVGASGTFDLLLTDLIFPKGQPNGIALARSALYHHPQLPVIYMTGDSEHEWSSKGVPESVLLAKPFRLAQLTTAAATLITAADTRHRH